ncbi:ERF family protein [Paenibacillus kobensis]|uniref:ERF family protein n=1 Tax=Paenibacillus kobensis TaxID=59841 RepID=UPI000FDCD858|nr:ERF family protein [Paenibacillus kobensis]
MNIYQKLIEVRKVVPYLKKESQGHQYNYTGSSQVLAAVRNKIDELGLLLIPRVTDAKVTAETPAEGKKATTYFTELTMTMTWVNAEKPEETIEVPWYAQGIDTAGEKGVGKALTYAEKYFLLKQFNIATDKDDPDAFQQKQDRQQETADKKRLLKLTSEIQTTWVTRGFKQQALNLQIQKLYEGANLNQLTEEQANDFLARLKGDKEPA